MSNFTSFAKPFSKDGVFQHLSTKWIGRNIVYKDETPTTMDDAKELGMRGRPAGTAVLAELQTKARGAHDRQWNATNTGNIYVSFILHRPPSQQNFVGRFNVEVAAALAVVAAARSVGVQGAHTKWPNDVWVEGHKLAGCLCEDTDFIIPGSSPELGLSILGVGINVNADVRRSQGLQAVATSVCCELGGRHVDREQFLSTVCNNLETNLGRDQADLYHEFVSLHIFAPPCRVLLYPSSGGVKETAFQSIEKDWSITVKTLDGEILTGTSANFSLRPRPLNVAYVLKPTEQDSCLAEQVFRALVALINTAVTAVKFLHHDDLERAKWRQNASLVVVCCGDGPRPGVWAGKGGELLSTYLQEGGCVLGLEQGAGLMHTVLSEAPFSVVKVTGDAENRLHLQQEGEEGWLTTLASPDSVGFHLQPCSHSQVLASYVAPGNQGESIADPDLAAVAVLGVGRGHLGLCGVNLSQSFHDPSQSEEHPLDLRGLDLFKIDSLFTRLLKKLSP